jgi:hypothetical protein
METITAKFPGNCLVCGRTIPGGEERLELGTEDPTLRVRVHGEVCQRCVAESVLAAIERRLERDARKDVAELAKALGVEPAHFARATRHVEKAAKRQELQ